MKKILVTGGAGYVGVPLVIELLKRNYQVNVLDLYYFGENVLDSVKNNPRLRQMKGDIRDQAILKRALAGCDAVIHLACISNDPSFELDPELGRSINYDAFLPLLTLSKEAGVRRFIYASTSSVYGISDAPQVSEDHPLLPITDYSKYKVMCEEILLQHQSADCVPVIIRPATVCGYSPRLRLDLTVNILTNHAVNNNKITVFGGKQLRPNIHIQDIVELYALLLELPDERVAGKIYNAGLDNFSVMALAEKVRSVVQKKRPGQETLEIVTTPTDDMRYYRISSEKIKRELGFNPKRSIEDAVSDLVDAFAAGLIPNPMTDPRYYNIKTMQALLSRL